MGPIPIGPRGVKQSVALSKGVCGGLRRPRPPHQGLRSLRTVCGPLFGCLTVKQGARAARVERSNFEHRTPLEKRMAAARHKKSN
eukprot:15455109-Alexandrium_andersonii.AAC.1